MTVRQGDDTTRTPAPNDAEAPEQTGSSETTEQGERNDDAQAEYHKRQALEHKTKAEQLNTLFQQYGVTSVEALNEKLAQSPAARADIREPDDDDDTDGVDDALERGVDEWVGKGDAVASYAKKKIAALEQRIDRLTRGVGDAFVARDVEDKTLRDRAVSHYRNNKHRLGDLKAAIAEVEAGDLRKKTADLTAELAALRKKPDPDVINAPATHGREITATNTKKRKMTGAKYDSTLATMYAAGNNRQALDMEAAYARGEIELEG